MQIIELDKIIQLLYNVKTMKKTIFILMILASSHLEANEVKCLAENIYHEARGEPIIGQLAVAKVTLNRVRSKKYKDTICQVVKQYKQFSWTNNSYIKNKEKDEDWVTSYELARTVLEPGVEFLRGFKATHYHTKSVNPGWGFEVYAMIGNHIFYVEE